MSGQTPRTPHVPLKESFWLASGVRWARALSEGVIVVATLLVKDGSEWYLLFEKLLQNYSQLGLRALKCNFQISFSVVIKDLEV